MDLLDPKPDMNYPAGDTEIDSHAKPILSGGHDSE
jgi:hypothetical protein